MEAVEKTLPETSENQEVPGLREVPLKKKAPEQNPSIVNIPDEVDEENLPGSKKLPPEPKDYADY